MEKRYARHGGRDGTIQERQEVGLCANKRLFWRLAQFPAFPLRINYVVGRDGGAPRQALFRVIRQNRAVLGVEI